jgi:hypothetical protein
VRAACGALVVAVALIAGGGGACIDAEVTRIGPRRPALAAGCAVDVHPDGRPTYPVTDVASADVSCTGGREACVAELRKQACAVGADSAYAFSERKEAGFTHVTATLGVRGEGTAK